MHAQKLDPEQKRRNSRNTDLGFAAVCFAGFLEVFGLGSNQTPLTTSAAGYFAVSIPLLVGAAMLASLVHGLGADVERRWRTWIVLALDLIGALASIIGVLGIHKMFQAVSSEAAATFIRIGLFFWLLGAVWLKVELVLQHFRRRHVA